MIKVTYGTRPGMIMLTHDEPAREPIQIWEYREALKLAIDICNAINRAWPGSDLTKPQPSEQRQEYQE